MRKGPFITEDTENETGMKVTLKNGPQRHRAAEGDTERIKDQSSYS
jgi:hypothetical protein